MVNNSSHNIKALQCGSTILYLLTPLMFIISPMLFVLFIILQFVAQACLGSPRKELFIVLLLNGFVYSSVSLLGFRIYDWIIIAFFIDLIVKKNGHIKAPIRLFIFFIVVLLVFFIHGMKNNELLEVIRYVVSGMLVLIVLNAPPSIDSISKSIVKVCAVNLYNALAVFALIKFVEIQNYTSSLISTNIYIYSDEVRLNGFFSDPNKYMTFSLALIFIIDLFVKDVSLQRRGIFLLGIATIISMSRTALLCLCLYFFLKYLLRLKQIFPRSFWICIAISIMILGILVVAPDTANKIVNEAYKFAAQLLGRSRTLEINATLQEDNRIRIWKRAIEYIKAKPLLGNGWLAYQQLLPYPTHNTILSLLLDGGLFLLVAYLYMFWPLLSSKRFDVTVSCVILPMLLLDLGNYRVLFLLLAMVIQQKGDKFNARKRIDCFNKKIR